MTICAAAGRKCSRAKLQAAATRARDLEALRTLIEVLPREDRRKALESLSMPLKKGFVEYLESYRRRSAQGIKGDESTASEDGKRVPRHPPCASLRRKKEETLGARKRLRGGNGLAAVAISAASFGNAGANETCLLMDNSCRQQGICALPGADGSYRYFARVTINGVAINSRTTEELREAAQLSNLLRLVQQEVMKGGIDAADGVLEQLFKPAAEKPIQCPQAGAVDWAQPCLSNPKTLAELQRHSWAFRALVNTRRWTNTILSSRTTTCVVEALRWRDQLDDALHRGWHHFRTAWQACMPIRRLRGAEDAVTAHLGKIEAQMVKVTETKERAAAERQMQKQLREQTQIRRKLDRLVPRLERRFNCIVPKNSNLAQPAKQLLEVATPGSAILTHA